MTHSSLKPEKIISHGSPIDLRGSTWQIFRIMAEFVEGYQFLTQFQKQVTIFGSARTVNNSKYYRMAVHMGELLAKNKYTTITGGGPGIMEAGNKGAFEAGGMSVGLNIELPHEQHLNPYVRASQGYFYFLTRKVMLTTPSQAFVCFPGGFGTLDELFEVLDQMHHGQLSRAPIILMDRTYWDPLMGFLKANVFERIHALEESDFAMIHVVDTPEEAIEIVKKSKPVADVCALDASKFCSDDAVNWRVFRIMAELVEGFEFLRDLESVITVIGTPRVKLDSSFYRDAYQLSQMIAKKKIGVLTGGGSGIMEAANKGAFDIGGGSYGMNAIEGTSERINSYVRKSKGFSFPFTRKLMLTTPSCGFVLFPGGYGTLNLCFEILTLIQTRKIKSVPIVLYGSEFWNPLLDFIKHNQFEREHAISVHDLEMYHVVDDPVAARKALGL